MRDIDCIFREISPSLSPFPLGSHVEKTPDQCGRCPQTCCPPATNTLVMIPVSSNTVTVVQACSSPSPSTVNGIHNVPPPPPPPPPRPPLNLPPRPSPNPTGSTPSADSNNNSNNRRNSLSKPIFTEDQIRNRVTNLRRVTSPNNDGNQENGLNATVPQLRHRIPLSQQQQVKEQFVNEAKARIEKIRQDPNRLAWMNELEKPKKQLEQPDNPLTPEEMLRNLKNQKKQQSSNSTLGIKENTTSSIGKKPTTLMEELRALATGLDPHLGSVS